MMLYDAIFYYYITYFIFFFFTATIYEYFHIDFTVKVTEGKIQKQV